MKYIVLIVFVFSGVIVKAQLPSSTFMSRDFNGNTKADWLILDSPLVNFVGAALFNARYAGTQFVKIGGGDTAFYFGAGGNLWFRSLLDRDTISLSNRINLKLNISDTTSRWWGVGKRWVDTVYRVNDSTIGYTINNGAQQTFQILGRLPSGGVGSGTVTSVGLSLPSAFNVTPSSITTSGTFAVTGAGTTLQYIRGNGTLATTDSGMIPNFHLKVRSLISGSSPITFNQTTGIIGITNANTSGTKGAATFNNSHFADNGSGLISLSEPVSAGSCTGCNLNITSDGRIVGYTDGAGGATNNVNIGSGFRPVNAITQEMRTYFAGFGQRIDSVANANGLTWSVDTTRGTGLPTYYYIDSLPGENISNASLTANGSYTQNWSDEPWVVDSIASSFLFRMGGIGSTGTRRKEFRINWGGSSFGDQFDGYNMMAVIKKADNVTDSLRLGLIANTGVLSMGAYDVATASNNTFISYNSTNGLININAKDSILMKGAVPAATADSLIGIINRTPATGAGKIVKVPYPAAGGATLNNIGTGFAWAATPSGNIKRAANSNTILWDSTSTANSLTAKVDTSVIATQYDLSQIVAGAFAQGDTIVYLSRSSGVISDADISAGSTTFGTDNTTAIQSVLDIASHTQGLYLVWDVRISTTGLRIGPNTFIQALPSYGAILRDNSDKPLFRNRDTAFGREPVDSNITVQGGIWNGNSYNSGLNPAQAVGTPSNGTTAVFSFYGVRNLIVRDFVILRQRTYAIAGNTLKNALYENGVIDAGDGGIFSDGVHFDGNSEHCTARNLKIHSIDDAVGMNADDAYDNPSSPVYGYFPNSAAGPISDIQIENIYLDNGQFGIRILSGASRVDNIRIKNITGNTIGYAVIMDNFWQDTSVVINSGVGNIGVVQIENVNVDITGIPAFPISQAMINLHCNAEKIILKDLKRYGFTYPGVSTVRVNGTYTNINSLVIDGYDSQDTTTMVGIDHILIEDATINYLTLQRVNVKRLTQGGGFMGANNATINKIQINNIVLDSVNYAYFNSSATVNSMTINNVNHISRMWGTYNTVNNSGGTISSIAVSNYLGSNPTMGAFGSKIGDAFPATTTQPGYVTTTTQSISGDKELVDRTLFTGAIRVPMPVESSFIDAYTSTTSNDALLIRNNSTGATLGIKNSNALGFSGIEYLSETGVTKVFSGMNNNNGQEFRFNNIASGGYIRFLTGGNEKMQVNNTGGISLSQLSAPVSTYHILVHGLTDSIVYQIPVSSFGATTIYNGNGTLAADRNVSSGGFTLRIDGANNSDTLVSITNTGTSSTGLYSIGSLFGIDAQSTNVGLRAFGTVTGLLATGDGSEGAVIKSNTIRGATIQSVPSSTNTVQEVLRIERGSSGGAGGNGIAGSVTFYNKASDNSSNLSNAFTSEWVDATVGTRTSRLSISGVNSGTTGTLATFDGNGNVTFGATNAIVGTATNNNAVAGNVGEEVNSTVSTYTNYTTTATYQNIASITLTAGDWDLSAFFTYSSNSATITAASNAIFVVSTTTASASGATEGKNIAYLPQAALLGTSLFSDAIAPYRVSISGTTTFYLNTQATFTLGNPQYTGSLRARRAR